MPTTRAFKSGNSQAIRIPADIAYADTAQELNITRVGDVITIFPVRGDLRQAVEILRRMPKPASVETFERIEMPERIRY